MKRAAVIGAVLALTIAAFYGGRWSRGPVAPVGAGSRAKVLYYIDPMHPAYRSDRPGTAPDCGMALVPVTAEAAAGGPIAIPSGASGDSAGGSQPVPGTVAITPEQQRLIGVKVEVVRRDGGPRMIRATGRVEVDGDRLHRLMAGTEGWVRAVGNNPVGTQVTKDEALATLYSREIRNAQQAYLGSLASLERLRGMREPAQHELAQEETAAAGGAAPSANDASLRINEEALRALGMGDAQIRELRKTRQITSELQVNAPIDGFVLSRDISPGQRFETGAEFYRIADLSRVWITADILGEDPRLFRPGTRVHVAVRESAASADAVVSQAPPFFDAMTRTLKLRLEADNPGFLLRPDMFVDIELPVKMPPALTIPIDALLDSGLTERVFVERASGEFEPRVVTTGWRASGRVAVVSGLKEGERVVAAGTFLVDSESQLRAGPGAVRP